MHLVTADNVVLSGSILFIQPDIVGVRNELGIRPSKLAIAAGVMESPGELFAGDVNDHGVRRFVGKINRSPYALYPKNQDGEDQGSGDQQKGFSLRIVMPISRALRTVR